VSKLSILLIGDTNRSEFRDARASLDSLGRVAHLPDTEAAAAALGGGEHTPDAIVIAQAYPSQFSHRGVDRLRRLAPLARILGLMGSWCEGEMRTGKPWPGVIRVYWHQWRARCHQQFGHMIRGESSAWALPVTATEEERLLAASDDALTRRQGLIAIYTRLFEMEDWLSAACRSIGCSTVWLRPPRAARVEGATAAMFDGSGLQGDNRDELAHLCTTLRPAPVIAIVDFPRIEDHRRAMDAGAAAVVSKPLHVEDLFWELDRVLDAAAPRSA